MTLRNFGILDKNILKLKLKIDLNFFKNSKNWKIFLSQKGFFFIVRQGLIETILNVGDDYVSYSIIIAS